MNAKYQLCCCVSGSYEVLFYDGFKKVVQRINIKPDHRVSEDKCEDLKMKKPFCIKKFYSAGEKTKQ